MRDTAFTGTGNQIADFPQQDTGGNVRNDMLFDCHRGNTNRGCNDQRECLIPRRDFWIAPYPAPAEPAGKTVDGREQIIRMIQFVSELKHPIENTGPTDFRPHHGSGEKNKRQQNNGFPDKMSSDEAESSPFIEPNAQVVVYCPKEVTPPIDQDRPWQEGDQIVCGCREIKVVVIPCKPSSAVVNQEIIQQCTKHQQNGAETVIFHIGVFPMPFLSEHGLLFRFQAWKPGRFEAPDGYGREDPTAG